MSRRWPERIFSLVARLWGIFFGRCVNQAFRERQRRPMTFEHSIFDRNAVLKVRETLRVRLIHVMAWAHEQQLPEFSNSHIYAKHDSLAAIPFDSFLLPQEEELAIFIFLVCDFVDFVSSRSRISIEWANPHTTCLCAPFSLSVSLCPCVWVRIALVPATYTFKRRRASRVETYRDSRFAVQPERANQHP